MLSLLTNFNEKYYRSNSIKSIIVFFLLDFNVVLPKKKTSFPFPLLIMSIYIKPTCLYCIHQHFVFSYMLFKLVKFISLSPWSLFIICFDDDLININNHVLK